MFIYKVVEENLRNSELGSYIAYGISVYLRATNVILISISDIFLERNKAEKLVELCNKNGLEPIHLREVVEDAIGWMNLPIFPKKS